MAVLHRYDSVSVSIVNDVSYNLVIEYSDTLISAKFSQFWHKEL